MNPPADGWGMIDNDTSPFADHGYGDWAELPGGDVYAVNYLVDHGVRGPAADSRLSPPP